MANYVKVEVRRHEDPYWAWRWECLMCTENDTHTRHDIALMWASEHARTCPGVRAATERDQALAILHRYRMPVQQ